MPDPSLSDAIKEAYAVAPAGVVTLHTMELRHPEFDHPIRVVRNFPDTKTWVDLGGAEVQAVLDVLDARTLEKVGLVARLESTAPEDAGQMVYFIALSFDFELPPVDITPVPEMTLQMDNVGREISDQLQLAATSTDKIEIIYRPYVSTDIDGPDMDPPIMLTLSEVEADPLLATGKARMLDIGNKSFPGILYTAKKFPGLAR